ncbi:hypothetical protein Pmar_PMAR021684, partial [Perkinsus marinus ATCC 50983]
MRTHVCKRAENQTRITHFIPTADVSDEQKRSIREAALVLLSEIGISYLSFESPAMINFVRVISSVGAKLGSPLDAQRILPSETTLRRDMVKLAQSRQQDLKVMISKQRRPLQICFDCWHNTWHSKEYIALTLNVHTDKPTPVVLDLREIPDGTSESLKMAIDE